MDDIRLETARLVLMPAGMRWRAELMALFHEPDVSPWLFLSGAPTLEQLTARIGVHEAFWRAHGYGMFAVTEKDSGRFVGRVGALASPGPHGVEIAWATVRAAWGKGYAVEAAQASVRHAFAHGSLAAFDCFLRPDNVSSRRVAEKAGFRYRDTRYAHDRVLRYYTITRADLPAEA